MTNQPDRANPYGEVEAVEAMPVTALEATVRAEVDVQVTTAKKFPRSIQKSLERCEKMALSTPETAEMCFYSLRRGGKVIEGPSVRFAEILANTWGNLRIAARVMDVGEKQVVCCACCHDLETNTAISQEETRRITGKDGGRFSDDMVAVTCNASCAIAMRNSVIHCIPRPLWEPIYERCREEAGGTKRPLEDRRQKALAWFKAQGIAEETVLRRCNRGKAGELTREDLLTLAGIRNAIREGSTTAEEAFSGEPAPPPAPAGQAPIPVAVDAPRPPEAPGAIQVASSNVGVDKPVVASVTLGPGPDAFERHNLWKEYRACVGKFTNGEQLVAVKRKLGVDAIEPDSPIDVLRMAVEAAREEVRH